MFPIGGENFVFHRLPCLRGDRMADIPKAALLVPTAGHGDKKPFRSLDHLDIVYCKIPFKGELNKGAQPVVLIGSPDFNVGDVHTFPPDVMMANFCTRSKVSASRKIFIQPSKIFVFLLLRFLFSSPGFRDIMSAE